jgi:sarcosine oxidase
VVIEWGEPAIYGLPTASLGWYKLAEHGTGLPVDPADEHRSLAPDPTVGARLGAAAARILPGFGSEPVAEETCLYDNTPDRDFILDRRGRFVVGAGTSGHGFKFAPLLGAVLAGLALGHDIPVPRGRFALGRQALHGVRATLDRPR